MVVVGRTGKRLKIDKHNKVKKHHISAFLELICKQLPLHLPPAPTISQGVAQCPSVESPPPSHVVLGSWRSVGVLMEPLQASDKEVAPWPACIAVATPVLIATGHCC